MPQETESTAATPPEVDDADDPIAALDELEGRPAAGNGDNGDAATPPAASAAPEGETAAEQEARLYAGKFKSDEELERGYINLESEIGRLRNEVGTERARREAYERTYQPPPGQQQAGQGGGPGLEDMQPLTEQQLQDLVLDDPLAAMDYMATMRAAELVGMAFEQFQPVIESVNKTSSRSALDGLKERYGDDVVLRNKERVAEMIEADREFFLDPETREQRLSMAVAAAEFERQAGDRQGRAAAQRRADNGQFESAGQGDVHVEGGSTPPQPSRKDDVDPIIEEMDRAAPERDAFGARPGVTFRR